jgi:hypothetical protein
LKSAKASESWPLSRLPHGIPLHLDIIQRRELAGEQPLHQIGAADINRSI